MERTILLKSKNLALDINLKIILLNYQNNYVEYSMSNISKNLVVPSFNITGSMQRQLYKIIFFYVNSRSV